MQPSRSVTPGDSLARTSDRLQSPVHTVHVAAVRRYIMPNPVLSLARACGSIYIPTISRRTLIPAMGTAFHVSQSLHSPREIRVASSQHLQQAAGDCAIRLAFISSSVGCGVADPIRSTKQRRSHRFHGRGSPRFDMGDSRRLRNGLGCLL